MIDQGRDHPLGFASCSYVGPDLDPASWACTPTPRPQSDPIWAGTRDRQPVLTPATALIGEAT